MTMYKSKYYYDHDNIQQFPISFLPINDTGKQSNKCQFPSCSLNAVNLSKKNKIITIQSCSVHRCQYINKNGFQCSNPMNSFTFESNGIFCPIHSCQHGKCINKPVNDFHFCLNHKCIEPDCRSQKYINNKCCFHLNNENNVISILKNEKKYDVSF